MLIKSQMGDTASDWNCVPYSQRDRFTSEKETTQCFSGIHFSSAFHHLLLCHLPFFSLLGFLLFYLTLNGCTLYIVLSTWPVHAQTSPQHLPEPLRTHFTQARSHQCISTKWHSLTHQDLVFHLAPKILGLLL